MKNKRVINIIIVVSIFMLFAFAFRKLWGLGMLAYNDCRPFPNDWRDVFRYFISSWDSRSPGINLPLGHTSFVFLFGGILTILCGGNAILAQKFFLFLPMPLAFISMYFFLCRYTKSIPARLLTALLYSISPMVRGELQGGFVQNIYIQAIMPILVMLLFNDSTKRFFPLLLFSIFVSVGYVLSDHIIIFIAPFILWGIFRGKKFLDKILTLPGIGFICFVLTMPHSLFFLKYTIPFIGSGLRAEVKGLLTSDVSYCYGRSSLVTILRLGAGDFYPKSLLVYLPFIFTFIGLFFIWKSQKKKEIIGYTLLGIITIVFIWLTYKKLTLTIFNLFPILFRFRNHARPLLFLSFVISPIIAIGLTGLQEMVRRVIFKRFIWLFLFVIVIFYGRILFAGDFGLLKAYGKNMEIPSEFYKISEWLKQRHEREGVYRTLWLPWEYNEEEIRLGWLDQNTLNVPIGYGQYAVSPVASYIDHIYRNICYERTEYLGTLLVLANVKYVILYLDSRQKEEPKAVSIFLTPYAFGDPLSFKKILDKQRDLMMVVQEEKYIIYENRNALPKDNLRYYKDIVLVSGSFQSDPLEAFSQLVNNSLINPTEELLIFEEQIGGEIDFPKDKATAEVFQLKPLLHDDFTINNLNEKHWQPVGATTYSIKNGEITLPLQQGEIEFLLSRQEFIYPMIFEMRLKICKSDLSADIKIESSGENGINFSYNGELRVETYNNWKTTTTNFGDFDPSDYHTYKIIWEKDKVQFFLDNVLKAVHTTNITNKWVRIRFGGTSGQMFVIDYVKADKGISREPLKIYRFKYKEPQKRNLSKIHSSRYKIELESTQSVYIGLSEPYDRGWVRHLEKQKLHHFPVFYWINGFSVNEPIIQGIDIVYSDYIWKRLSLYIFSVGWIVVLAIVIYQHKISRGK